MNKRIVTLLGILMVPMLACSLFTPRATAQEQTPYVRGADSQSEQVENWNDEDGHAVVGDSSTPRFYPWVFEEFIPQEYPGAQVQDNGSWMLAILPDGTVVAGAEWGEPSLSLGQIDGLYDGKSVFVAMRDFQNWVTDSAATHYECTGTLISKFDSARMNEWPVPYSTIIQIENGNAEAFSRRLDEKWSVIRSNLGGCP